MRIPKQLLVFSLILFLISTVLVSSNNYIAYACSCSMHSSPQIALEESDAVFSGKVIKINDTHSNVTANSSSEIHLFVTFDVDKVWKGPKTDTITIQTALMESLCGFNFEENQEYLVYANQYKGEYLEVSLCSGTSLLLEAIEDIQELNPEFSIYSKLLSPLKQFKSGISANQIQCNGELTLRLKHDGTPVCLKQESAARLNERGWTNIHVDEIFMLDPQKTYHSDTYIIDSFEINYAVIGADLSGIFLIADEASLVIKFENVISDGEFIISIPRELLDSKLTDEIDDEFFVLVDGEEVRFDEIRDSDSRSLTILFDDDNSKIQIIAAFPL